jgi:hypothetical protein
VRVGSGGSREVVSAAPGRKSGAQSGGRVGIGDGVEGDGDGGYEIYVDATDDPELDEEILVVRKKKSRAGLDAVGWGAASPSAPSSSASASTTSAGGGVAGSPLRIGKEKTGGGVEKWWSIGRGRRDSKDRDRDKENQRARCTSSPSFLSSYLLIAPRLLVDWSRSPIITYRRPLNHNTNLTHAIQLARFRRFTLLLQQQQQKQHRGERERKTNFLQPDYPNPPHTHAHAYTHTKNNTQDNTHAFFPPFPSIRFCFRFVFFGGSGGVT